MRKNLLTLEQLGPGDCYPKSASLPPRDENIPARFALHRSLLLYLPVTKVQRHDVDLYLRSIDPSSLASIISSDLLPFAYVQTRMGVWLGCMHGSVEQRGLSKSRACDRLTGCASPARGALP
ncbi:hypothetical protein BDA96_09G213300 [Sorghum bicolor]|uniref:Uncharacterized protein n=2 Tax=Sorghum bicolor TaxID=4558 RepID=A0A921QBQ1_SORBI|nr:hypothetical protein BDA96_09G213300 [Sorghum bicolor]OQU78318.1 hypothetical protein SORBI_3009G202101 [Sorghum bicolor]